MAAKERLEMKDEAPWAVRLTEIRKQAESRMKETAEDQSDFSTMDLSTLVYELQTHQIELEMQNEELRRTQSSLEESHDRFVDLYDFAPIGYATISADGLIIEANLTMSQTLLVDRKDLLRKPFSSFVSSVSQDVYYYHHRQLLDTRARQICDLDMTRADGVVFQAQLLSIPVENEGDMRLVLTDVTERKAAEEREKELQEKLTRSERMESLGVLAGGVAHDLNNSLGPLVLLPDQILRSLQSLAIKSCKEMEMVERCLDLIKSSSNQSVKIVRDLVTLAMQGNYSLKPYNLLDMSCIGSICSCENNIRDDMSKITFHSDLSEAPVMIMADGVQLQRVFLNLVHNAAQSIRGEGFVTIKIFTECLETAKEGYETVPAGNYAVVSIADTGHGISGVDLPRIFEPFFTRKKRELTGGGLGLSIVRGIVQSHKGFIDVESIENTGSIFTVYIPLLIGNKAVEPADKVQVPLPCGTERILIVDDEGSQRYIVQLILNGLGYAVAEAENGNKALDLFREAKREGADSPYDLVILDMRMEEDFDGLSTFNAILELYPEQKFIISSGHADGNRIATANTMGADLLPKPFCREELAHAVRARLERC